MRLFIQLLLFICWLVYILFYCGWENKIWFLNEIYLFWSDFLFYFFMFIYITIKWVIYTFHSIEIMFYLIMLFIKYYTEMFLINVFLTLCALKLSLSNFLISSYCWIVLSLSKLNLQYIFAKFLKNWIFWLYLMLYSPLVDWYYIMLILFIIYSFSLFKELSDFDYRHNFSVKQDFSLDFILLSVCKKYIFLLKSTKTYNIYKLKKFLLKWQQYILFYFFYKISSFFFFLSNNFVFIIIFLISFFCKFYFYYMIVCVLFNYFLKITYIEYFLLMFFYSYHYIAENLFSLTFIDIFLFLYSIILNIYEIGVIIGNLLWFWSFTFFTLECIYHLYKFVRMYIENITIYFELKYGWSKIKYWRKKVIILTFEYRRRRDRLFNKYIRKFISKKDIFNCIVLGFFLKIFFLYNYPMFYFFETIFIIYITILFLTWINDHYMDIIEPWVELFTKIKNNKLLFFTNLKNVCKIFLQKCLNDIKNFLINCLIFLIQTWGYAFICLVIYITIFVPANYIGILLFVLIFFICADYLTIVYSTDDKPLILLNNIQRLKNFSKSFLINCFIFLIQIWGYAFIWLVIYTTFFVSTNCIGMLLFILIFFICADYLTIIYSRNDKPLISVNNVQRFKNFLNIFLNILTKLIKFIKYKNNLKKPFLYWINSLYFFKFKKIKKKFFFKQLNIFFWNPVFKKNSYFEYFSTNIFWKF